MAILMDNKEILKLKKYIKRYTKKDVKIHLIKYFRNEPNIGAKYFIKKNLLIIVKSELDYRPLIWHEMGHIATSPTSEFCVKNEVNAQLWVMKNLKKLKYKKLYKESIEYIKDWNIDRVKHWKLNIYSRAKNIILKDINEI